MKNKLFITAAVISCLLLVTTFATLGPFRNAFNAGETAPLVKYRIDLQQYGSACQTLENMYIKPQGTASRRPGTEYIADVNDVTNTRIISFERSTSTAYVLEFGNQQLHFYINGGQIQQ